MLPWKNINDSYTVPLLSSINSVFAMTHIRCDRNHTQAYTRWCMNDLTASDDLSSRCDRRSSSCSEDRCAASAAVLLVLHRLRIIWHRNRPNSSKQRCSISTMLGYRLQWTQCLTEGHHKDSSAFNHQCCKVSMCTAVTVSRSSTVFAVFSTPAVAGYIPRWFTRPQTITHLSIILTY